MSPSVMTSLITFTRLQSYFRPKTADFAKSKYVSYGTPVSTNLLIWVLRLQTLKVKNDSALCQGPLTAGGL